MALGPVLKRGRAHQCQPWSLPVDPRDALSKPGSGSAQVPTLPRHPPPPPPPQPGCQGPTWSWDAAPLGPWVAPARQVSKTLGGQHQMPRGIPCQLPRARPVEDSVFPSSSGQDVLRGCWAGRASPPCRPLGLPGLHGPSWAVPYLHSSPEAPSRAVCASRRAGSPLGLWCSYSPTLMSPYVGRWGQGRGTGSAQSHLWAAKEQTSASCPCMSSWGAEMGTRAWGHGRRGKQAAH